MDAATFIAKWRRVALTERSAAQQHFLDLCELLGHPKPAESDPTGEFFTFERGIGKLSGGDGWADVWKKGFFGFEYKGKHKDLHAAYRQLLDYRENLDNPPLLVVCDLDRIVIHTNFTNTAKKVYEIPLADLGTPRNLEILRALFFQPEKLKPGVVSEAMTIEAAERIGKLAVRLRDRGLDAHEVAHFLDRLVFCCFAEDVGLLPEGIFSRLLEKTRKLPERFAHYIRELFSAMSGGGDFLLETIRHFNGNLFNDAEIIALTAEEIEELRLAAKLDWSAVDASIFGTLFERGMDPDKRTQLGAHYTSRQDIETLVDPVVMTPLRREWDEVRQSVSHLLDNGSKQPNGNAKTLTPAQQKKVRGEAEIMLHRFLDRLSRVKVLDPACGSGNFLYVTLQKLKDLEKEVIDFALQRDCSGFFPNVGPWQLYGIEINGYAHDLAQMAVWIGYLQWTHAYGYPFADNPVLRPMNNFQCQDAILDLTDPEHPRIPEWPAVDFIIGNPPFLGGNKIRKYLGDAYVAALFALYEGRVPAFADLCCYWFEHARAHIEAGRCKRAGLLATQGIRGGANREVLKRIKTTGEIFWAIADREWILEGANVHVSLIAFDAREETTRTLDGHPVPEIHPDLSSAANITSARPLPENQNICFMGPSPKAKFDISADLAREMLAATGNPNGRPNADVIRPVASGIDLVGVSREKWTIDFGLLPLEDAAQYTAPFEYVKKFVYPTRVNNRRVAYAEKWWQYAEARPGMRRALHGKSRYLATPEVAKHRIFVWVDHTILCNQQTLVFARDDDYFFGVLHSRLHELWALKMGTQLREKESGFRYTPTTCFETFPFPRPTVEQTAAIAAAARVLDDARRQWLGDGRDKTHTLTNLYNDRPTWLALAHGQLDDAVFSAYGWETSIDDAELLARLLSLNLARVAANK